MHIWYPLMKCYLQTQYFRLDFRRALFVLKIYVHILRIFNTKCHTCHKNITLNWALKYYFFHWIQNIMAAKHLKYFYLQHYILTKLIHNDWSKYNSCTVLFTIKDNLIVGAILKLVRVSHPKALSLGNTVLVPSVWLVAELMEGFHQDATMLLIKMMMSAPVPRSVETNLDVTRLLVFI